MAYPLHFVTLDRLHGESHERRQDSSAFCVEPRRLPCRGVGCCLFRSGASTDDAAADRATATGRAGWRGRSRSRRAGSRKPASTSSSSGSTTCRRWRPSRAGKVDAVTMTNGDALVTGAAGAKSVMILVTDYSQRQRHDRRQARHQEACKISRARRSASRSASSSICCCSTAWKRPA